MLSTVQVIEPLDSRAPKELTDSELVARALRAKRIHDKRQETEGRRPSQGIVMLAPTVLRELWERGIWDGPEINWHKLEQLGDTQ